MNSDGSNNLSLKYERYASSGFRDIGIRNLGFVAKTNSFEMKFKIKFKNYYFALKEQTQLKRFLKLNRE